MNAVMESLAQLLTWQTPLSFLAGVGSHHLWCKYVRDRKGHWVSDDDK